MPRAVIITALFICGLLASASAVVAAAEIGQDRAHQVALYYFERYFPRESSGGARLPSLRADYWESTVAIGYAGTPRGIIRIHRYSGIVSYRGPFFFKPRTSAKSLERWAKSR